MANKPAAAAAPYYTPVVLRIPSLHRGQIDLARAPCKFLFIKMPVRAQATIFFVSIDIWIIQDRGESLTEMDFGIIKLYFF
uniref:Uncharacterized protein n=1 Tax=Trichogramma kaykai TaxID=54128 RepID=A0ABD2XD31_9HYME